MPPDLLRHALQFGYGSPSRRSLGNRAVRDRLPNDPRYRREGGSIMDLAALTGECRALLSRRRRDRGRQKQMISGARRGSGIPANGATCRSGSERPARSSSGAIRRGKADLEGSEAYPGKHRMLVGRIYRKFIAGRIAALAPVRRRGAGRVVKEQDAQVNDPLYLSAPSQLPVPFDATPMFQTFGERDEEFHIDFKGKTLSSTSGLPGQRPRRLPADGPRSRQQGLRQSTRPRKSACRSCAAGPRARPRSILDQQLRSARTLVGASRSSFRRTRRNLRCYQQQAAATTFSHMVNFDWQTEAEPNEPYVDFKRRLTEEGDHRVPLIEIVRYIEKTLSTLRNAIADQGKGRRGPAAARRHERRG